jgi:predicted ester cyclase
MSHSDPGSDTAQLKQPDQVTLSTGSSRSGQRGCATGATLGVPADGKPVRWSAVDIYRVTDGKISEEWAADDIASIMVQVGAFTPPWAA